MPQIYEFLRYIDSQFNTFDSQNAFCESIFLILSPNDVIFYLWSV